MLLPASELSNVWVSREVAVTCRTWYKNETRGTDLDSTLAWNRSTSLGLKPTFLGARNLDLFASEFGRHIIQQKKLMDTVHKLRTSNILSN